MVHFTEGGEEASEARIVAGRRGAAAAEIPWGEDGASGSDGAAHGAVFVGALRDGGIAVDPESEAHIRGNLRRNLSSLDGDRR